MAHKRRESTAATLEPAGAKLPRVPVPVLLLAGERDLSTPLAWAQAEAKLAPRGRLVIVPEREVPVWLNYGCSIRLELRSKGQKLWYCLGELGSRSLCPALFSMVVHRSQEMTFDALLALLGSNACSRLSLRV